MKTILDQIVQAKRQEVAAAMQRRPPVLVEREASKVPPPRDFYGAVAQPSRRGLNLIAEIKKASPSAGVIVEDFDPVRIARVYHEHGAAAISVLTDEAFFRGRLEYIEAVKGAVPLPVLRKDFIVDPYQIFEARVAGADAVLLIAEVLTPEELTALLPLVRGLRMTALIEVHTEQNLTAVLDALGPPGSDTYLLGINNRDLTVQRTDLATTARLAGLLPSGAPFVTESGIATRDHVLAMRDAGACAMLVGESLLRAEDIGGRIDKLLARGGV